jgi:LacI family transcriptional regulator
MDVAKQAGVSVTTVSRVLNNNTHPVNEKTRAQVLAAAKELNYRPNALARALVSDRSRIIGVIVGDASDPYFATIIRGVSDVAHESDYLTFICNSDREVAVELNYVRLLLDYHVDGILFAGGGLTNPSYVNQLEDLLKELNEQGVVVMALGGHLKEIPQVTIDNCQATQEMTEYLIGLGHQRIGFIDGPSGLTTSAIRLGGYKQALSKHAIPFDPQLVVESDFTYENGLDLTDRFLEMESRPTAIFGSNDRVAIGCLVRLNQRGVAVPDQISVVGFDDITTAQQANPPLTTIRVPMREMGRLGMNQILSLLNDEEVEMIHIMPHELVVRASSGPVPE